ncbi:hypothetical protein ACV07N_12320 [Roseivirga echinicomitans]
MILDAAGFLANAILLEKDLHKEENTSERDIQKEREIVLNSAFGTFDLNGFETSQLEFNELQTGSVVDLKLDAASNQILVELGGAKIGYVSSSYYRKDELKLMLKANKRIQVKCIRKDLTTAIKVSFLFEILA